MELNEVLVPVDFSEASRETFLRAQEMVNGESPAIILLHVIDPSLVEAVVSSGLGSERSVIRKLRNRADEAMAEMVASSTVEVTPVVSEGIPFYEIVRHAEEFDVDAVIIGKTGVRDAREALFFGSTAEKVVRACRHPVIVLSTSEAKA
ncbi:MAG: universal stress protein [Dehalococcoidia bacterium]